MDEPKEVFKREQMAGENQMVVAFVNRDYGRQTDVESLLDELAKDAAAREGQGWRLISVGGLPMRQMGTTGNVLFDSGGQYSTQAALVAVYARPASAEGEG